MNVKITRVMRKPKPAFRKANGWLKNTQEKTRAAFYQNAKVAAVR